LSSKFNEISQVAKPDEVLLVVDAMTGQEAANLVKAFNDDIGITGAVLTKMDGDTRGGAALTIREISGRPIKFTGVGEKMEALVSQFCCSSPQMPPGLMVGDLDMVKSDVRTAASCEWPAEKSDRFLLRLGARIHQFYSRLMEKARLLLRHPDKSDRDSLSLSA
jgi:hypothetical protein